MSCLNYLNGLNGFNHLPFTASLPRLRGGNCHFAGLGRAFIEGKNTNFGPNTILITPPEVVHQIINGGNEEVFLIAAFSSTPARVFTPEGKEMCLLWQAQ
jgi:hypothetical protein